MSGWPMVALGKVADWGSGGTPSRKDQGNYGGDIRWATISDLPDGPFEKTNESITSEALKSSSAKLVPPGSVLIAMYGASIGKLGLPQCPMATNQAIAFATPFADVLDRNYLFRVLQSQKEALASAGVGGAQPNISQALLKTWRIPCPPLAEQQRIAAILDHADALRAKRRDALARLDELTQAIFVDMFGADAGSVAWPTVTMGEACNGEFRNGLSPSTGGAVLAEVLTLSAVTGSAFDSTAVKEATFSFQPPVNQSVNERDLLISRGNGNLHLVGKGYFPPRSMPATTFPDTIIAARVDSEVCGRAFLQHAWGSPPVRRQIEAAARTTNGTYKVNQTMLAAVQFALPPMELQAQFGASVASIDHVRTQHSVALAELDSLFASLQSRAFRGEL